MKYRRYFGLLRSLFIYYLKPFQMRRMNRFYGQFIRPGDLCFDIGAHVGNRSSIWSKLGAKVICVEPQRNLFSYLQWHFKNRNQVLLVNTAVGSKKGMAELTTSPSNPTVNTLSDIQWREALNRSDGRRGAWRAREIVEITTLDSLIDQYGMPAFCKIDVEGWEEEVFKGLTQPLPKLSFECLQPAAYLAVHCIRRLMELDEYSFNLSMGERMRWEFKHWLEGQEMIHYIETAFPKNKSGDIYAFLGQSTP